MAKMKGIVLSLEKSKMAVVTEEGDFLQVPVPSPCPRPGETVYINVKPTKSFTVPYWLRIAVAVLILGLSLVIAKPLVVPEAIAAVSMDLNSSVELNIDSHNKVLYAQANDDQGRKVLQGLNLKGLDIYLAANTVTIKAIKLGYLKQNGKNAILVTVAPLTSSSEKLSVNREKLQQVMHDELVKQKYNGYLVVNQEQEKLFQEAEKMGLTVNQYLLWKRSQEQGAKIDIKEVRQQPVDNFIAKNDTGINQMFPGMWCRVGEWGTSPVTQQSGGNQTPPSPRKSGSSNNNQSTGSQSQSGGWNSNCGPNANWPNYCDRWGRGQR